MSGEILFTEDRQIVSKTNTKGIITYCNKFFMEKSGYSEEELLGKPHNIVRHPDMPQVVFKLLWKTLGAKKEIDAYVKNRAKDGRFYWVLANVTPSLDKNNNVVGYHSVRFAPDRDKVAAINAHYIDVRAAEKSRGLEYAEKLLLEKVGGDYEKFILNF